MKDALQLLVAGVAFAALAWIFWHFAGQASFSVLTTLALAIVLVDNVRLRRRLKRTDSGH